LCSVPAASSSEFRYSVSLMRFVLLTLLVLTLSVIPGAQAQDDEAQPVYYLALGDSIAAGYSNEGQSYVGVYAGQFAAASGKTVVIIDKTRPAWNSRQLLDALRHQQTFKVSLQNANIVTWNIAGNDFIQARFKYLDGRCGGPDNQDCLRQAETEANANWVDILEEILEVKSTDHHLLRTMDIYNPFVREDRFADTWTNDGDCDDLDGNGACSDFEVFFAYGQRTNEFLEATAAQLGVPLAKASEAFNGPDGLADPRAAGLIAGDGIHPNDQGHALLAQLLSDLTYLPVWPEPEADPDDADGDGVPNEDDLCPNFPGAPIADGC